MTLNINDLWITQVRKFILLKQKAIPRAFQKEVYCISREKEVQAYLWLSMLFIYFTTL